MNIGILGPMDSIERILGCAQQEETGAELIPLEAYGLQESDTIWHARKGEVDGVLCTGPSVFDHLKTEGSQLPVLFVPQPFPDFPLLHSPPVAGSLSAVSGSTVHPGTPDGTSQATINDFSPAGFFKLFIPEIIVCIFSSGSPVKPLPNRQSTKIHAGSRHAQNLTPQAIARSFCFLHSGVFAGFTSYTETENIELQRGSLPGNNFAPCSLRASVYPSAPLPPLPVTISTGTVLPGGASDSIASRTAFSRPAAAFSISISSERQKRFCACLSSIRVS